MTEQKLRELVVAVRHHYASFGAVQTGNGLDIVDAIEPLLAQVAQLTLERDDARANARILAHSWTTDSRPPARAVDAALAYPVMP